jgi:endonuclease/exonuclease/phosphatase family metal-dependent hydrolase
MVRGLGLLGVFFAACALAAGAGAANPRTTTVMTINVYQGTELEHVVAAGYANQPDAMPAAVSTDYANVVATNFPQRAQALAQEIVSAHADLVGLQEVATWSVDGVVSYDFAKTLIAALAARGQRYHVVIVRRNFGAAAQDTNGHTISLTEQTAIIARTLPKARLRLSNAQSHDFTFRTTIPFLGGRFDLGGGWVSVDATIGGTTFRFATTHMDPELQLMRDAQAKQIVQEADTDGIPLVLAGDTNSDPATPAYATFVGNGLKDVWAALHPGDPGLTCCHVPPDAINDPNAAFDRRVDYVFAGRGVKAVAIRSWNTRPSEMVGGLWPTDHAALAATLRPAP